MFYTKPKYIISVTSPEITFLQNDEVFYFLGASRRRGYEGRATSKLRPLISFDSTERDPDLSPSLNVRTKRRCQLEDRRKTW
jgi:hypothetical protein